jgi:hypothetical protein
VVLVDERRLDGVDASEALDEDLVRSVDHDLGNVGVAQQGLDRPVPEDLVEQFRGDPGRVRDGQRRVVSRQHVVDGVPHLLLEHGVGGAVVIELRTEDGQQLTVHPQAEGGRRPRGRPGRREVRAGGPVAVARVVPL